MEVMGRPLREGVSGQGPRDQGTVVSRRGHEGKEGVGNS